MEFVLIIFLLIAVRHNLTKVKKIRIKTSLPKHMKFLILIGFIVFFYIAYWTRHDLTAYLTASLVSLFFLTAYSCKGFAEDAIYILRGSKLAGLLVTRLSLEKVEKMEIVEKKKNLQVKIKSDYGQIYEYFTLDQKEELETYIEEKRKR